MDKNKRNYEQNELQQIEESKPKRSILSSIFNLQSGMNRLLQIERKCDEIESKLSRQLENAKEEPCIKGKGSDRPVLDIIDLIDDVNQSIYIIADRIDNSLCRIGDTIE
ncbi:MAG: hypothetical protein M0R17_08545 [Candidatus Omnitrophica bacterium]|jgi:uncharacterized protein Yka (UPF0111/DUF47 family)|nr:hypothetical protein [Candidatus Omnitrophota bacterium]